MPLPGLGSIREELQAFAYLDGRIFEAEAQQVAAWENEIQKLTYELKDAKYSSIDAQADVDAAKWLADQWDRIDPFTVARTKNQRTEEKNKVKELKTKLHEVVTYVSGTALEEDFVAHERMKQCYADCLKALAEADSIGSPEDEEDDEAEEVIAYEDAHDRWSVKDEMDRLREEIETLDKEKQQVIRDRHKVGFIKNNEKLHAQLRKKEHELEREEIALADEMSVLQYQIEVGEQLEGMKSS